MTAALAALVLVSSLVWLTGRVSAQGSDEIPFYKHTIDLGISEAAEVADVNRDGKLDIISGENWYEQTTPGKDGPRWIKHHFRDLPFIGDYLEDLGDLAIDVNGDGYPDVVTSSYWTTPLAWWENPGKSSKPWVKHVIETRLAGGILVPGGHPEHRQAAATVAAIRQRKVPPDLVRNCGQGSRRALGGTRGQPAQLWPRHRRG